MKSLRIAINAQLRPGGIVGGVEQFLMGLVHSLGQLNDGPEEYIIISHWQEPNWLEPYLGPNQRIIPGPRQAAILNQRIVRWLGPFRRPLKKLWMESQQLIRRHPELSPSSAASKSAGFYESLGVNLIHFPYQSYVYCGLPALFNPHDLQHLHYPQYFTQQQLCARERLYPVACQHAQAIATESQWVKADIIKQYGIEPKKIYPILRGSPTELYAPITDKNLEETRRKFQIPNTYAFYPAQTWPSKNHIRLLKAIKLLKDQHNSYINLICTGTKNEFWPTIAKCIRELELDEQVHFLGFVSTIELRSIYHLSQFVVFPTLFEGGGFPVLEAFWEGVPITCSAVTSLPEYGGNAVLYFDATSVESIAAAMRQMSTNAQLRTKMRQRANKRIRLFTWERTAMTYRALYRKLAGQLLSHEERILLASD